MQLKNYFKNGNTWEVERTNNMKALFIAVVVVLIVVGIYMFANDFSLVGTDGQIVTVEGLFQQFKDFINSL